MFVTNDRVRSPSRAFAWERQCSGRRVSVHLRVIASLRWTAITNAAD